MDGVVALICLAVAIVCFGYVASAFAEGIWEGFETFILIVAILSTVGFLCIVI